jgi:hypothetical protein
VPGASTNIASGLLHYILATNGQDITIGAFLSGNAHGAYPGFPIYARASFLHVVEMGSDYARHLLKQGYHSQAVEEIQSHRTKAGNPVEFIILLAEIYTTQGYLNHAYSILTVDVQNVTGGDEHALSALSMIRCFTGAIVTGKIWICCAEANGIYSDAAAFLKADPTAPYAVRSSSKCILSHC